MGRVCHGPSLLWAEMSRNHISPVDLSSTSLLSNNLKLTSGAILLKVHIVVTIMCQSRKRSTYTAPRFQTTHKKSQEKVLCMGKQKCHPMVC